MLLLLLLASDKSVQFPVFRDHSVPLGLGVQYTHYARLLPERIPSKYKIFTKWIYLNFHSISEESRIHFRKREGIKVLEC